MKGVFYLCVLYRLSITQSIKQKFIKIYNSLEILFKRINFNS